MASKISEVYPIFSGTDGLPLEDGYIYIGLPNENPTILAKQVSIYSDESLTTPVAQPVRTLGGYPVASGTPINLYVSGDYSILVKNKNDNTVYSSLSGNVVSIDSVDGLVSVDSIAALRATDVSLMQDGTIAFVEGYYAATVPDGGGREFYLVTSGGPYVDNNCTIIVPTGGSGTEAWHARDTSILNVKQCGAKGDGSTDDRATLAAIDTLAASAKTIFFPAGSYKIDLDSAGLTLNSDLAFESGAKLVLYRTSGTNRVDIRGDIQAPLSQIFDVTNITATAAAWNTLWLNDPGGSELPLVFGYGTTSYNQFDRTKAFLAPDHFGAAAIGTDSTLAVQVAFDSHRPIKFARHYDVTQVTLRGNELYVDFNNFKLRGVPGTTDYSSILEIKCGYSTPKNMRVDGQKSQYYQCGIHWYTNDTNIYYVGHNRIDLPYIEGCYIQMVIGGLPGQTAFAAQGSSVTAPEATDAPLSESIVYGFDGIDSLCSLFANQPNGKVEFDGGVFATPTTAGFSNPAGGRATLNLSEYSTVDLRHPGTEISITSGSVICTDSSNVIPAITVQGGRLSMDQTVYESVNQVRIKAYTGTYAANGSANAGTTYYAESYLIITNIANFGLNLGLDVPWIVVDDKASGMISIDNCYPTMPNSTYNTRTAPMIMVTDTFSGLDAAATKAEIVAASTIYCNPYMSVRMSNTYWKDQAWQSNGNQLVGITQGLPDTLIHGATFTGFIQLDTTPPADDPQIPSKIISAVQASGPYSPIAGLIDPTGITVAAAAVSPDGGWTIATTGAGAINGTALATGPIVPGDDITAGTPDRYTYAIEIDSGTDGAGGTASIESPDAPCEPARAYMMSFFIYTPEATPGSYNFLARIKSYDFDGVFLSEDDALQCSENQINDDWTHVIAVAETNKNAATMRAFFYAENGAKVRITDIRIL